MTKKKTLNKIQHNESSLKFWTYEKGKYPERSHIHTINSDQFITQKYPPNSNNTPVNNVDVGKSNTVVYNANIPHIKPTDVQI